MLVYFHRGKWFDTERQDGKMTDVPYDQRIKVWLVNITTDVSSGPMSSYTDEAWSNQIPALRSSRSENWRLRVGWLSRKTAFLYTF